MREQYQDGARALPWLDAHAAHAAQEHARRSLGLQSNGSAAQPPGHTEPVSCVQAHQSKVERARDQFDGLHRVEGRIERAF